MSLLNCQRSTASSVSAKALARPSRAPGLSVALSASAAHLVDALLHGGERFFRERRIFFAEVLERIERRLRVARAGESARNVTRFEPQAGSVLVEKRLEQPQIGAPAFHLRAHAVDRERVGLGARLMRGLRQHRPRDGDQRRPDRLLRVEFRLRAHGWHMEGWAYLRRDEKMTGRALQSRSRLLHNPRAARPCRKSLSRGGAAR